MPARIVESDSGKGAENGTKEQIAAQQSVPAPQALTHVGFKESKLTCWTLSTHHIVVGRWRFRFFDNSHWVSGGGLVEVEGSSEPNRRGCDVVFGQAIELY